jgi:hypothetical protein
MARNHEIGDIVMTIEKPKRVAVIISKYHVISEIQYDIYLPESERFSYSWSCLDLERVVA